VIFCRHLRGNYATLAKHSKSASNAALALRLFCWLILCGSLGMPASGQASPATSSAVGNAFTKAFADGSRALREGDNAAAEKSFRVALAVAPESVEVLNDLAISLARQGLDEEAISLYLRALKLKPGDPITGRNLGVAYFRAHRYKEALPLLEAFAKSTPTFQALDLTGLDLFALDRYADAIVYLEQANHIDPNDLPTLDVLGKAYWREKKYTGVTGVFDRIMAIDPESAQAHFMLGLAYDVASREQDALREFEAALKVDPSYSGGHSSLGLVYWKLNETPQAETEFQQELSTYPNDPVSNYMMGQILRQQDKPALAVPYLEKAVAVNPSYRDALFELGQCLLTLDRPEEAVKPLEKAIEADPAFAQAHFVLAKAFSMTGRSTDAARERNICKQLQARQHAAANPIQRQARPLPDKVR
jgi:tetratricopeptide (TPR) repeat protein